MGKMKPSDKCHLIVAGAQKAGTTWLHNTLEYQSEYWCPKESQEVHFFDRYYDRGYRKYENKYEKAKSCEITFDVTPAYLCNPLVSKRIKKYEKICKRPIKIIVLLRDPVERAVSAYKMKIKKGGYNLKLSEALNIDTTLLEKSRYAKAIKKYKRYFGRRLKIFITEEVFDDSCTALRNIQQFTGAEESIINIYEGVRINSSSRGGARPIIRMGGKVLRYLGAEKIVHEVKKTEWAQFLRQEIPHEFEPVVDAEGVELLKEELADEARMVAKMIDQPDVESLWNLD